MKDIWLKIRDAQKTDLLKIKIFQTKNGKFAGEVIIDKEVIIEAKAVWENEEELKKFLKGIIEQAVVAANQIDPDGNL